MMMITLSRDIQNEFAFIQIEKIKPVEGFKNPHFEAIAHCKTDGYAIEREIIIEEETRQNKKKYTVMFSGEYNFTSAIISTMIEKHLNIKPLEYW